jgi:uncharacterized protein (TIGR02646 family)
MKKEVRKQVHEKCGGHCAYCGEDITLKAMQVDHIKPKRDYHRWSDGHYYCPVQGRIKVTHGVDDIENLNPSCRKCNNFKTAMSLEEFRRELESQVARARRYSVNFRMAEKYGLIQAEERPIVFYFEKL